MKNQQSKGHVYKTKTDGVFGVVTYFPETVVRLAMTEAATVTEACAILAERHGGEFVQADTDTRKWGECLMRGRDFAEIL